MPMFTYTPQQVSDPSFLTEGMHPAFLVAITDEETPAQWEMAKKSPRMWRWSFAVWQDVTSMTSQPPELQSTVSSQTFSPGGKYQPSKAFVWTCALLGRQVQPTESIDLDPMMPLPCQLYITRKDKNSTPIDYANVKDLVAWGEGAAVLTPELRQKLQTWWQMKQATPQAVPTPQPQQTPSTPPPAAQPPAPNGWAAPSRPQQPAAPAKSGW